MFWKAKELLVKKKVDGARIICIFEAGFFFDKAFKVKLLEKMLQAFDNSVLKSPTNSFLS